MPFLDTDRLNCIGAPVSGNGDLIQLNGSDVVSTHIWPGARHIPMSGSCAMEYKRQKSRKAIRLEGSRPLREQGPEETVCVAVRQAVGAGSSE